MRISVYGLGCLAAVLLSTQSTQAVHLSQADHDFEELVQTFTESTMIPGAPAPPGGGGGGGSGGGGTSQNTPSINIIDNARIMMLPGSVPMGGAMMAQESSE